MRNYLETAKKYKGYHRSVLSQESFDYLHKRTLEIFRQIKSVLERNNIRYMVCGGTLLGAVTTGKFIPWDDDFDMCIFEEDYARAINLLIEKMPKDVIVQCEQTEPRYFHGWAKVRDVNTKVIPATESYGNNGVWVDLYRLSMYHENEMPYRVAKEHLAYLRRRLLAKDITKAEYKHRVKSANIYNRIFWGKVKSMLSKNKNDVYVIWSASKIILQKEWVRPLSKCVLEGEEMTTFNSPEKYLAAHYGNDYAVLPPEELRMIGISEIQFIHGGGVQRYSRFYIPLLAVSRDGTRSVA